MSAAPTGEPRGPVLCVACLVTHAHNLGKVLLVRSAKRGGWELPGGKVGPDETPRDAVQREVLEETGLGLTLFQPCEPAILTQLGEYVVLVYRGIAAGNPKPQRDDAIEARWFKKTEIPWGEIEALRGNEVLRAWNRS